MKKTSIGVLLAAAMLVSSAAVAQEPPKPGGPPGRGLLEMDSNGDGGISRAEFDAGRKAQFERMDGNRDGRISGEEMRPPGPGGPGSGPGWGPPPGAMPPPRGAGFGPPPIPPPDRPKLDANNDGVITRAEYDGEAKRMFDNIDGNKDGRITDSERQQAFRGGPPRP